MIIQNSSPTNQAVQPDLRVSVAAPVKTEARPVESLPQPPAQSPEPEALKRAVADINRAVQATNHSLEFSVDGDTETTVVKVVDTSTGEMIRQFPSEAALAIARDIDQRQQGLLLQQEA